MGEAELTLLLTGLAVGLIAGGIGGTMAGIAGVGGGLIYVPVLFVTLPGAGETLSLQILGSLVAVAITGFFSAKSHFRLGHLHVASLRALLPGLMLGAALGLWSTLKVPEAVVLAALGLLDAWIAWDYGRERVRKQGGVALAPWSVGIGYVSGFLGVGGGTLLVPLLRRNIALRMAVGTSSACGALMAIAAVAANLLLESSWRASIADALPFLLGFWAGILCILPFTARFAAGLHAMRSEAEMRYILKMLFAGISVLLLISAAASVTGR